MDTHIEAVANALKGSRELMNLERLCHVSSLPAADVKNALRELAYASQIEVISAAKGQPARYGWLASAKPVVADTLPPTANGKQEAAAIQIDGDH